MENNRLLYDAFNIYYETGMQALKNDNYESARLNLYSAAETILKLAKKSSGPLKEQRFKRADELFTLAGKIEQKQYNTHTVRPDARADIERVSKSGSKSSGGSSSEGGKYFTPVSKPEITLDDVAGLESVKDEIRRRIVDPQKYPDIYKKFKKKNGGGILLYGVPGTGKTMIAQAIAGEINAQFFAVKCSDIVSKWFGEAEQNIKNLFDEARKYPTSIIFFDEFESLGAKRDTHSTVMKRIVPELLAQIQGFDKSENTLLIIAATNRPWDIDSGFVRSGRLSTSIYVPLPDDEARRTIISKQLQGIPVSGDLDVEEIVKLTDGFNGADVVEFCERLKDCAIDRTIATGNESKIVKADVEYTAKHVKSSVKEADLRKIAEYEQKS